MVEGNLCNKSRIYMRKKSLLQQILADSVASSFYKVREEENRLVDCGDRNENRLIVVPRSQCDGSGVLITVYSSVYGAEGRGFLSRLEV
ncbi:Hypothetical predicted protein [Olea europaea subsp. europaea]|uniref:Uncharacterized protein n=1 Tax=Olea europaea subsp. europaea TaxID=158383 RepID=A0A8S0VGL0_OLEEU|nr:Hypothetical predicted protein [Olea europaea subsp. europaea]